MDLKRLQTQDDRVTDAHKDAVTDLARYRTEMEKIRGRRQELNQLVPAKGERARQQVQAQSALDHLESFCGQVSAGLGAMTSDQAPTTPAPAGREHHSGGRQGPG